jgi:hypothetical protein
MPTWRRTELAPGTYDELISARLERQLAGLDPRLDIHRKPVAHTEAIGVLIESLLGEAIDLALSELKSDTPAALALAEEILAVAQSHVRAAFPRDDELRLKPERLLAITRPPAVAAERPIGSLHASSLIVNAEGDRLLDLLLVTLEKAPGVKEHLRYRDFPLNEDTFHWQSKARTTRDSAEGRRHLDPMAASITPLLFVRERADHRPGVTMGFTYLGPVAPEKAEGERPITIEWRLAYPMPLELIEAARIAS